MRRNELMLLWILIGYELLQKGYAVHYNMQIIIQISNTSNNK